ncbi:hypothetical protein [Phormidium sp. CCY1219]|uniref:hypothetical protein n=1 Tax=Phormidium sp. CCY1219 TaxID=2886104 RepID=UPI002D1F7E5E|nr:hypothetical protein [Phormidium sp. CCY1219]MEB3829031.1 hypothetical protein [Phormidium sp. CCY1219]
MNPSAIAFLANLLVFTLKKLALIVRYFMDGTDLEMYASLALTVFILLAIAGFSLAYFDGKVNFHDPDLDAEL